MNITKSLNPEYRPDIDGLRALAVIFVILFHLDGNIFKAGFIGVDVFFVISGYLITRKIKKSFDSGHFDFREFYESRARRILPPILITLCLVMIASGLILAPFHFERAAEVALSSLSFISNFYFWKEAGYFDISHSYKPFLHTWSLSLEEQFYLIWPVFILALLRSNKASSSDKPIIYGLLVLILASLLSTHVVFPADKQMVFYLLPFRISEFLIGALCVWLPIMSKRYACWSDVLFGSGLILIFILMVIYKPSMPFPGLYAFLPCIGTALIILHGNTSYLSVLLTNRLFVGIGLISYSLYLLHWPVLVLGEYYSVTPLSVQTKVLCILFAMLISILMYFTVEIPIRRRAGGQWTLSTKKFILVLFVPTLFLIIFSANVIFSNGWSWRVPEGIRNAAVDIDGKREKSTSLIRERESDGFYEVNPPGIVVIGDSYANDIVNALALNDPVAVVRRLTLSADCQPFFGQRPQAYSFKSVKALSDHCDYVFKSILESDEYKNAELVIFASYWNPHGVANFLDDFDEIKVITRGKIIVMGPRMVYGNLPYQIARHGRTRGLEAVVEDERFKLYVEGINRKLREGLKSKDAVYVDVLNVLCGHSTCPVLTPRGHLMVYDAHHWTMEGAAFFGFKLKESDIEAASLLFNR